jgi:hypothetical protein
MPERTEGPISSLFTHSIASLIIIFTIQNHISDCGYDIAGTDSTVFFTIFMFVLNIYSKGGFVNTCQSYHNGIINC